MELVLLVLLSLLSMLFIFSIFISSFLFSIFGSFENNFIPSSFKLFNLSISPNNLIGLSSFSFSLLFSFSIFLFFPSFLLLSSLLEVNKLVRFLFSFSFFSRIFSLLSTLKKDNCELESLLFSLFCL